ncbi:MAG: hypothetical protein GX201_03820 [Clostridiales bacterium]|nr:hypothetical protein [Clostridiales bacterium]
MKIFNEIGNIFNIHGEQSGEIKIRNNAPQEIKEVETKSKSVFDSLPQELRQALERAFGQDVILDRKTMEIVLSYLEKYPGTIEEKIEVIINLLNKELDISTVNLKLIHEALFGKDYSQLLKELNPDNNYEKPELGSSVYLDKFINDIIEMESDGTDRDKVLNILDSELERLDADGKVSDRLTKVVNEEKQTLSSSSEADDSVSHIPVFQEGAEKEYATALMMTAGLGGKQYLVTEVTTRLKEAAQSFKELKRDIANNLDMVLRNMKTPGTTGRYNAKINLAKAIDLLDKAILKSDIALFGDMKLEKELLKVDSQLQEAKVLLDKGEYDKAWSLVDKIKNSMESLNWKPSKSRILHYASLKEVYESNGNTGTKLSAAYKALMDNFKHEDYTPRKVYEAIKLLGGDHEGETARYLIGEKVDKSLLENNIKSLLLSLPEKEGAVLELINKISGNQLLNKDNNGLVQTMFFALPLMIKGKATDMKIYINSKKDDKKVDWKNCSIYFLIDTEKLGQTGILLQASGGNINITIRNDREDLKEKANPLLQEFKENLKELGYEVGLLNFTKLNSKGEEKKEVQSNLNNRSINSFNPIKKGFDMRI